MTQTTPRSTDRLTSRQRRIEEQRRKIEAVQSRQRRKRMLWLGGIVIVVAVAIVAVLFIMPRGAQGQMRQVTTETASHVEEGAPLTTPEADRRR